MAVDQSKLEPFVGRAIGDLGGAISALLLHIGDKLGLYKAMAGAGQLTPAQLATRTGTAERYIREWLCNQAAGGYVSYDSQTKKYFLNEEQALCLAEDTVVCTPASLSQEVGLTLGAQAGEQCLRQVFQDGGFSRFRRATETPFNLVLEARP